LKSTTSKADLGILAGGEGVGLLVGAGTGSWNVRAGLEAGWGAEGAVRLAKAGGRFCCGAKFENL